MAADHYKEKFKECQKLQKQVNKFTEQAVSRMGGIALAFFNFSAAVLQKTVLLKRIKTCRKQWLFNLSFCSIKLNYLYDSF